ncbi:MAG: DNA topoisomerase 3 [Syntrophobacteraceae bacterium]
MATLILTEKPSVAQDFARALGIKAKKDGYLEGEGYVITWAIGHLVELYEPQDYDDRWKTWSMGSLPILPEGLKYKPIQKVKKQLEIIRRQVARKDVEEIVIATDAGREGEVIARTILQTVEKREGPLFRFWTSQALTPNIVRKTLKSLKPAAEYDRLWNAGQARQAADWLVGMNLSRAATLKLRERGKRDVFSVGRVQTAVLSLLVDRKRERERFKPEPYWVLRANFSNEKGTWWGTWFKGDAARFDKLEEANRVLAAVEGQTGAVRSVKKEKKQQPPPLLYSLTDLQREANTRFGLSAQQTLNIAQKLYEERKCLSYPRTDSRVLGSENVDLAQKILADLSGHYPDLFKGVEPKRVSAANKRVFNDAKLTDHHALIPLAALPPHAAQGERQIYELVLKRFAAVFHADYEYEATEVVTAVRDETFRTRGSRPLVLGWKAVYGLKEPAAESGGGGDAEEEENLPPLEEGDPAAVAETKLEEKTTQPPQEYTEALLLKDMTNPSRYVSEEELRTIFKGDVGLGTQATRAQIIETLIGREYVVREKKKLAATEKGCFLIDSLRRFPTVKAIATPEETARWEMQLERIAQGAGDSEAFITGIKAFVTAGVSEFRRGVREGERAPGPARSGAMRPAQAGRGGREPAEPSGDVPVTDPRHHGWTSAGAEAKPSVKTAVRADIPVEAIGKCPKCGGEIIEGKRGYGCRNWREQDGGCRFVIWKVIAGKALPMAAVRHLLQKGETGLIPGFVSRKGSRFSAKLRLEGDDKAVVFVFADGKSAAAPGEAPSGS